MIPQLTTIGEWAATLRITKSQLQTYLMCPRKFFYQYVAGAEPEFTPPALPFGRAIHSTVAYFYKALLAGHPKPELDTLVEEWRMNWAMESADPTIQYDEEQTAASLYAMGRALLERFHADIQPRKVEAVEHPFAVAVIDPDSCRPLEQKLVGVIDLIESEEDGHLIVSELKTKAKKMSDNEAENQLDALIYAYALDQLGMRTSEDGTLVRIDVLTKTKTPALQQLYVTKQDGDFRKAARWIRSILQAIERESFYPTFGWACKGCQFYKQCMGGMSR